ncbi:GNAT family N-acetyltransferase [Rhodococcus opacus]|uniref:GNAT family N-acetyltransferase n=1 Tax=Rhodococcus opacus TaxID=37919 RepID=UPI0022369192|nr:GNAT family N-acetyltransferase [Rhodococcus opacus]UZG60397.1 GNAT family N-acetyltransferase [Rhodococcus opacus]
MSHAQRLVDAGVEFRGIDRIDIPTVTALVRKHITGVPDFQMHDSEGGGVAISPAGEIIGAVVIGGATFETGRVTFLRDIVVVPEWRGRGLGTVLLNQIPKLFAADLIVGNCAPSAARLYANAGFTVLRPKVPLPFPMARTPHAIVFDNDVYPCAIYREIH